MEDSVSGYPRWFAKSLVPQGLTSSNLVSSATESSVTVARAVWDR
jgi:hypothetical protein